MLKRRLSPADFKELTQDIAIREIKPPSEVILPLLQHTGAPPQPKVVVGNKVKVGTKISQAKEYVSAPIHASVSGEVKAIENRPHPVLGQYKAIVIESDGQDNFDSAIKDRQGISSLSAEEIRRIIRDCGVVGLGGAAFPTHVKLTPPKEKSIDTFILNGAECEPYLTADYRLMIEKTKEILKGVGLIVRCLGTKQVYIAIEDNKPEAIKAFKNELRTTNYELRILKAQYPQGAEKQLIKTVLAREVPPGGLPFDVGVVVNNVATCFAIYEAVYKNKPLYERVITVAGRIVKNPGNLKVRLGTKVKDVLDACGLTEQPAKVILGGPMMGLAQYTLDVPVIKGTSGVIVFGKEEAQAYASQPCIRCGRCIQACPVRLNPSAITQAIEKEKFDQAREYNVLDCIECGICSYVCPANRDVVGLVKLAKQKLK